MTPTAALHTIAAWLLLALAGGAATAQPVKTGHVTAELVARQAGVAPGQTVAIGLRLQHIPHWHTYWRNPGDSGLPTKLSWQLPPGAVAGDIEWPAPQRLPFGPLMSFGYEGDLLLPLRFTAPADAQPGSTLALSAEASWLVCREVCIPENATLTLALPVVAAGSPAQPTALASRFDAAERQRPQPLTGWRAELLRAGRDLQFRLTRDGATPAAVQLPAVQVFPYTEQLLESAQHRVFRVADGYLVELALDANASVPASVPGIVVAMGDLPPPWGGVARSAEFNAPVRQVASLSRPADAQPLADALSPASGPGGLATAGQSGSLLGWVASLGLAFVGGMLLNLMPCVFPVLSIKLLGLARQTDQPAALRGHALAYAAGVVLSFLALAALLLALRAGGQAVGWGFQLQSPGMVYALALLFAALGLNLMGVFEVGLTMPQGGKGWSAHHPLVQAAGSGVLAVLAASPCTAPFMGAALGAALTQPAPMALGVFAALGLGMALPYALLVLLPGWRRHLPRPGAWMLRLKQALAFPMFATVVWLLWVLGQQTGMDALARALIGLLGLALGVWWWGVLQASASAGRRGRLAALAVAAGLLAWGWPTADAADDGPLAGAAAPGVAASAAADPARWLPYSDPALRDALAQGRTVFVDFTAAWCVSCQVNKRLVLDRPDTLAALQRAGVVLMRADWTRRDAAISAALNRLGRSGVPVYLLQRPGQAPVLLPEILTQQMVLDALARR
jgi:thiol:disulfide interchange protein/DsbC/DsbD-like thiol-disulfide interchange protein